MARKFTRAVSLSEDFSEAWCLMKVSGGDLPKDFSQEVPIVVKLREVSKETLLKKAVRADKIEVSNALRRQEPEWLQKWTESEPLEWTLGESPLSGLQSKSLSELEEMARRLQEAIAAKKNSS